MNRFFWSVLSIGVAIIMLLPVLSVFWLALDFEQSIWQHLYDTVLGTYVVTTAILLLGVGCLATVLGVVTAWLVCSCQFPMRGFLSKNLLLPLAMPSYLIAFVYTDLLEYAGPVQTGLRQIFGFESAKDYWFFEVRSLNMAIFLFSMIWYPYVYLLSRTLFLNQANNLLRVGQSLGYSRMQSFLKLSLPLARPGIVIGLLLVLMEVFSEFGAVNYFALQTLSVGVYDTWLNRNSLSGAAQISVLMISVVGVFFLVDYVFRSKGRTQSIAEHYEPLKPIQLVGYKSVLAMLVCGLPSVIGFWIPFLTLAFYAVNYLNQLSVVPFLNYALNSLIISSCAALLAIVAGVLLLFPSRWQNKAYQHWILHCAVFSYAVPGTVLAIGVIIPLTWIDKELYFFSQEYFGASLSFVLSGSLVAVIYGQLVRFLALSKGAIGASWQSIGKNADLVAYSFGYSPGSALRCLHLPLLKPGVLTAGLLVFIEAMKELPMTLLLRPFNTETLTTFIYQYASDERLEECALAAVLIVLISLLPAFWLDQAITKKL